MHNLKREKVELNLDLSVDDIWTNNQKVKSFKIDKPTSVFSL